jgi:hypothetical protein
MISRVGIAATALGLALVTLGLTAPSLDAQGAQRGNCTLFWAGNPDTRSVSLREGEDAHVTYVSGGMTWTCGTATMVADSAIKFDLARRVELIGNVRYRDTIRTLESKFLTYYEIEDRVIATDSVHLTRLSDGSTLTGPRVEFLRAVSGIDEETIATGRPHMVLYPEGDDPGPPFDIDADRAIFAGEEEARAFGDVIIVRPDLQAEADSAFFRRPEGTGTLYGSPWVEAEDIRLRGDTIRTNFENNTLQDVQAVGHAHAVGESAVEAEEVDAVWAHGDGRAEAVSAEHHLYGDSLRFAMWAGQLDTIVAVGEASAVQGSTPARLDDESDAEGADDPTGEIGAEVDTGAEAGEGAAAVDVEPDLEPSVGDSTVVPGEPVEDPSAESPDPAADPDAVDPEAGPPPGEGERPTTDDPPLEDPESPQEGLEGQEGEEEASEERRGPGYPRLEPDDESNWVTGDTLYAVFERTIAVDDTVGLPGDTVSPVDTPAAATTPGDSLEARRLDVDSLATTPSAQDTAADPLLERLTVIGRARSFYAQVRDSTASTRASRSYMIGQRIDIFFQDGEPKRVDGVDAIGVYLDPLEAGDDQGGEGAPPDSLIVPVSPDTTATPGDTTSTAPPPDSTVAAGGVFVRAVHRQTPSATSVPVAPPRWSPVPLARRAERRTLSLSITTDPLTGRKGG